MKANPKQIWREAGYSFSMLVWADQLSGCGFPKKSGIPYTLLQLFHQ
jgi:hypothetical protein